MNNERVVAVGIDVAKATLSICFHYQKGNEKVLGIRNTNTDITKKLLPQMSGSSGKIVMESTGHYHWIPALILSEAGFNVYVVNPLLAKQYTTGSVRKIKSDPADAKALARMARVADNLPHPFSDSPKTLWLRKKLGLLASFSKQVQALTANLKSVKEGQEMVGGVESAVVSQIEQTVKTLKQQMKKLEEECVLEMKKDKDLSKKIDLLCTIPGISEFTSLLCLHWFNNSEGATAKSWIAYAGLDISVRESGTWRGTCRLTKRGNAFLRKRLYSAAWGAWRNDENFAKYYDELRNQDRCFRESLLIISRKLIRTAFSVLETGIPYDAKKCFPQV
jgi:Transposase and inactivated derivatives